MADDFPKKVTGTDRIDPNQPVKGFDHEDEPAKPGKQFDTYMNEGTSSTQQAQNAKEMSPAELTAQKAPNLGPPTMESVLAQMKSASSSLGDINKKLQTPNLQLKSSQKYLLRNKLSEANSQLRAAASKSGVNVGPMPENAKSQNPIERFIGLVTDGQRQMEEAQMQVHTLTANGKTLKPGELLLVQLKVAKAQQELEYSSVVLSNAISAVKMLFNVQL